MSFQVPIAVHKGTRPSIPEGLPPKMVELWDIAQECWSAKPGDRPSFPTILEKLDSFSRMEDVTPFSLREPRPMKVKGEQPRPLITYHCALANLHQGNQQKPQQNGRLC